MPELLDRGVHSVDCRARQWLRDIPDAATDKVWSCGRTAVRELFHTPADLWEEIAGLQLQIIFVEVSHGKKERRGR
jgi:hypothetical protein